MGVLFLECVDYYSSGLSVMRRNSLYSCANCSTQLTNREQLISKHFRCQNGRAYLFGKVVNILQSDVVDKRVFVTGNHFVRDVFCKKCDMKLGWVYEFAEQDDQRYKEGKILLDRTLIEEIFEPLAPEESD